MVQIEMEQKDIFHNCRNCNERFKCTEKTDDGFCDLYDFDNEAATCDDCGKRENCQNYLKDKPTCVDWEPEVTCDDCTKQETCKNYSNGGRICKKFDEIRYRLTEKGCLYLAIENVMGTDKVYIDFDYLSENDFFEELDHEMRLSGLVSNNYKTFFGRFLNFIKYKICKPKKTFKDVFFDVAQRGKFINAFGHSDDNIELVFKKFVEILNKHYGNE